MGIATSYTMHLHYDRHQCTDGKYQSLGFGEYVGTSWASCAKEARKDGQRINADKAHAFVPGHRILRSNKGEWCAYIIQKRISAKKQSDRIFVSCSVYRADGADALINSGMGDRKSNWASC